MEKNTPPGVYINELPESVPSIAQVETAIPVFIGYTEKAKATLEGDLLGIPIRISSLQEYIQYFGQAEQEIGINLNVDTKVTPAKITTKVDSPSSYLMFYSLQAFYANGGGPCYITSVGDYSEAGLIEHEALVEGLMAAGKVGDITLIVFPDGTNISQPEAYYSVIKQSLTQCSKLHDRFTICDVYIHDDENINSIELFRNSLSATVDELKYGAAYYPYLKMSLNYHYEDKQVTVNLNGEKTNLSKIKSDNKSLYRKLKKQIEMIPLVLPPSAAIAGIYAQNDKTEGVWKAPANVNISLVIEPTIEITNQDQEHLNVDVTSGKSINPIRSFTGRGPAIVWGARTLAGNDNEWRYVPVRRFYNMVEESVINATSSSVFEPNDSNTWAKLTTLIKSFLFLQWRAGALIGSKPKQAYYVRIGLNSTMSAVDIEEGRLIIEIGMAVARPAEFIILKIIHKMQEA